METEYPPSSQLTAMADEECAEALLALAMSAEPISVEMCAETESRYSHYDTILLNSELLKRIQLDHNYYLTGEDCFKSEVVLEADAFKSYCESIKSKGSSSASRSIGRIEELDDVEVSYFKSHHKRGSPEGRTFKMNKKPSHQKGLVLKGTHGKGKRQEKCTAKKSPTPPKVKKFHPKASAPKPPNITDPYDFVDEEENNIKQEKLDPYEVNLGDSGCGSPIKDADAVLDDDKFRGLNLLLSCLGAEQEATDDEQIKMEHYSMNDDSSSESENEMQIAEEDAENVAIEMLKAGDYKCNLCCKSFTKKRYLTKHASRMHPGESLARITSVEDRDLMTCPSCYKVISKSSFEKHSLNCESESSKRSSKRQNENDLASCQFCHVRMRRHLLVRHLAQEHRVDKTAEDEKYIPEFVFKKKKNQHQRKGGEGSKMKPRSPKSGSTPLKNGVQCPQGSNKIKNAIFVSCEHCGHNMLKKKIKKHMKKFHSVPKNIKMIKPKKARSNINALYKSLSKTSKLGSKSPASASSFSSTKGKFSPRSDSGYDAPSVSPYEYSSQDDLTAESFTEEMPLLKKEETFSEEMKRVSDNCGSGSLSDDLVKNEPGQSTQNCDMDGNQVEEHTQEDHVADMTDDVTAKVTNVDSLIESKNPDISMTTTFPSSQESVVDEINSDEMFDTQPERKEVTITKVNVGESSSTTVNKHSLVAAKNPQGKLKTKVFIYTAKNKGPTKKACV